MKNRYNVEIGENKCAAICTCCGNDSYTAHGFVYKNGNAYAVYYAGWSDVHLEKIITIAVAIGEWSDDSETSDRTCFGLKVLENSNEVLLQIIEPIESPWANTDLLGPILSKEEALSHPQLTEIFEIIEIILFTHTDLHDYIFC